MPTWQSSQWLSPELINKIGGVAPVSIDQATAGTSWVAIRWRLPKTCRKHRQDRYKIFFSRHKKKDLKELVLGLVW